MMQQKIDLRSFGQGAWGSSFGGGLAWGAADDGGGCGGVL